MTFSPVLLHHGRHLIGMSVLLALIANAHAQDVSNLIENPGFEQGKQDGAPLGWLNGGALAGYPAVLSNDRPKNGRFCGFMRSDPESRVREYGSFSQMIAVSSLRNKVIRLTIFARTQTPAGSWSTVFYRVDRSGDEKPLFMSRKIFGNEWRDYHFDVEIPANAIRMQFGVTLAGEGLLWVDDASLVVIDAIKLGSIARDPSAPRNTEGSRTASRGVGTMQTRVSVPHQNRPVLMAMR
jgi:hypothetical protein